MVTQNSNTDKNKSVKRVSKTSYKAKAGADTRKKVSLPLLSESEISGISDTLRFEKYRSRNYMFLLYPDCDEHMKALEVIQRNYSFLSVTHDKDVTDDGEVKKTHIHVFVKFKNPKWNTAIADEIGLDARFLQQVRNEENAMLYLIHFNEEKKHHYSIDEVLGTSDLKKKLRALLENKDLTEAEIFTELLYMITDNEIRNISSVSKICANKGDRYLKVLFRHSYLFNQLVRENRESGHVVKEHIYI